ncbi:MAG: sugar ABC transporter ATP-binding protein [Solirubrobacterales bacterium]|nr:sugar ABC transporter ATP-binding protein [Solirubrobacterales bacterium]MBV9367004.1 sugar ABC transporter ATP-binding protein [Solirubrobacterales bacterium]MBV9807774.1 sugar ABC transporter ATP-binding protein [Solirubrobacterales bacterium]
MTAVLEADSITKRYGHVTALDGASFTANAGEVTALIGDNGAGKSTLVKILSGVIAHDEGTIRLDGERVRLESPQHARELGIETVFQDLALAPDLGPAENMFVGREILRGGWGGRLGVLDKARMRREALESFVSMGTDVKDMFAPVASLSGGQRQSVAICRSIKWASNVLFLDEPTAALGVRQTRNVLDLVRRVAARGVAVILISHNMPDVLQVSDRIEVLRLGRRVAQFPGQGTSIEQLVGAMTGALDQRAA